jgi:hypothetical protein
MEFYRNTKDLISYEGILVDAESLWKKEGELMILVDDDQHITTFFDEDIFKEEKK